MKITIISEKPFLSRALAPHVRQHWPDDEITFVHAVPYGNIKPVFPRGLKINDFPKIAAPVYGLASWDAWRCPPFSLSKTGEHVPEVMSSELITCADLIVCACDHDYIGANAFQVLMRSVFNDERADACPALRINSTDDATIKQALTAMAPFGRALAPAIAYGRVKRYFDWNWNVNALAVLGAAARAVGTPADAPPLSKFSLQVLYDLRKGHPRTQGKLINNMQRWNGTGRYAEKQDGCRPEVGSPASRAIILENLQIAGFAESVAPSAGSPGAQKVLVLTERGKRLLAWLHPDCEDADLPFRLAAWCEQGLDVAKPAIDRYLRTFFGKQMRFKAPDQS